MLIGGLVAAAWSAVLCWADLRWQRLPDALTLPACVIAVAVASVHPVGWWGMCWPLAYLAVGRGIGGGDIKLALPLGIAVAACTAGLTGVLAAMALASLFTVAHALLAGARAVAHGPSMIAAAWLCAVVVHK